MRTLHAVVLSVVLLGGGVLVGGFLPGLREKPAGVARPRGAAPVRARRPAEVAAVPSSIVVKNAGKTPARPAGSLRDRLAGLENGTLDLGKLEEEWEARLDEDAAFAGELFAEFLQETDPTKLSFLSNLIASRPDLRNDPAWQDRFMKVAETDGLMERRIPSLDFLEQAESIRAVRPRMFALAEEPGDIRFHVLISLKGLPDRRESDPELAARAARIADTEKDAELRGLALRIEQNPEHAARFLGDAESVVRMQAAQEVNSIDLLKDALQREKDAEVREVFEQRIEILQGELAGSQAR